MIGGSCLCGAITWQAEGALSEPEHCHCSICRKIHAAPFVSFTMCPEGAFRWVSGEDRIIHYEASPGFERPFCGTCGSALPSRDTAKAEVYLPMGALDTDPGLGSGHHIFFASKAPFHLVGDELPKYDGYPPNEAEAPLADPSPFLSQPAHDGPLKGSCQCASIAYEVTGPFQRVFNCHCSRCRKARAAAHATNGFVPVGALHFTRGEEHLKAYRLPEAQFFGQAFCGICGSGMPRENVAMQVFNVPLGTLDSDPERGADFHIFTSSKAPWFEITDHITQVPEGPS